jgi:thioredoxin reductase (NADPH)
MKKQAEQFGAIIIDKWIIKCDLRAKPVIVLVEDGDEYSADALIIATGATAKWLNLPNESKYINHGISACAVCDGPLRIYRNKHIYVVGGGDTAMEEATFLTKFASKVTIVHRRHDLKASKAMQLKAQNNPKIEFLWDSIIIGYEGEQYLTGLHIKNVLTDEVKLYEVGALFMGIGHEPMTQFLTNNDNRIELDDFGYLKVYDNVYTNIPGVFGCGDVHDTHYKQAITAAGFGCMAAMETEKYLS